MNREYVKEAADKAPISTENTTADAGRAPLSFRWFRV